MRDAHSSGEALRVLQRVAAGEGGDGSGATEGMAALVDYLEVLVQLTVQLAVRAVLSPRPPAPRQQLKALTKRRLAQSHEDRIVRSEQLAELAAKNAEQDEERKSKVRAAVHYTGPTRRI